MNVPPSRAFAQSLHLLYLVLCTCAVRSGKLSVAFRLLNTRQRGWRLKGEGKGDASLRAPRVSLAHKTPFPSPFKCLQRRLPKYVKPWGITVLRLAWLAQWIERYVHSSQRSGFDSELSLNFFMVFCQQLWLFIQLLGSCSLKSTTRLSEMSSV